MKDPINTLIELTEAITKLDEIQDWIDHARIAAQMNQRVQLELDRQQADVNKKRALIAVLMFDIRTRN